MNKSIFDEQGVHDLEENFGMLPFVFAYIVDVGSNDVIATIDQYSAVTGEKIFEDNQFDMVTKELLQIVSRAAPERKFVLEIKKNNESDPLGE
jgi:hypothetical protein